jgi:hypothetical protein
MNVDNRENIGDVMAKKMDYVLLTKWSQHYEFPSQGTMRQICSRSRRKTNGAEHFLSFVNGRFYINIHRFHEWMDNQKDYEFIVQEQEAY